MREYDPTRNLIRNTLPSLFAEEKPRDSLKCKPTRTVQLFLEDLEQMKTGAVIAMLHQRPSGTVEIVATEFLGLIEDADGKKKIVITDGERFLPDVGCIPWDGGSWNPSNWLSLATEMEKESFEAGGRKQKPVYFSGSNPTLTIRRK